MSGGVGRRPALLRALRYRALQNVVVVLVSALLATAAAFAPWYQRIVDDAAVKQAFAGDAAGAGWSLMAAADVDLRALLPARGRSLFTAPLAGRSGPVSWQSPRYHAAVEGGMVSRDDVCDHLVLVAGTCPREPGDIAVSEADAALYRVGPGDRVPEVGHVHAEEFAVTGVYRLRAADRTSYWFDTIPTERSGFRGDTPYADQFVTVPETFLLEEGRDFVNRLDTRVFADRLTTGDRAVLRDATAQLRRDARGQAEVLTSMDTTLDRLEDSRGVAASTLALMLVQVGVLGLVVLMMLVGIVLESRRRELGLGRLRGQGVRRLVARTAGEWLVVVLVGTALGVAWGAAAAALARSAWVEHRSPLGLPGWLPVSVAGTVLLSLGLVVLAGRQVAREPIPALLRSSRPVAAVRDRRGVVVDAVVVTAALAALGVGLQSGDDSVLVLLAPSLLAIAAGLLLARVLAWGGDLVARRGLARGRVAGTLAGVLLARPRGLPALVTLLCTATAFAVFGTQVSSVADRNRVHRGQVEAGAARVLETTAGVQQLVRALDAVDPHRREATAVVRTRTDTTDFVSLMLVEPSAFRRIAYGADAMASARQWAAIAPPAAEPTAFSGRRLTGEVRGRVDAVVGLEVDYLDDRGVRRTTELVPRVGERERFGAAVDCAGGCRLLRWVVRPDHGRARGTVEVTGLPLDLAGTTWHPVLPSPDYAMTAKAVGHGIRLAFRSGGLAVSAQQAWAPREVPAILSRLHASSADFDSATVPLPGRLELPLDAVGLTRDAVPGVLRNVAVADLAVATRLGESATEEDVERLVWLAPGADAARIARDLAAHDVRTHQREEARGQVEHYTGAPESLADRVGPAAGVLALLLALLGLLLTVIAGWRGRSRDLAALRLTGIPRRTVLVASYSSQLVVVLAGVVVGAACGLLGARLALARLRIFGEPERAIARDLALDPGLALLVAGGCALVLAGVAAASAHWLVRRAEPARIAELDG